MKDMNYTPLPEMAPASSPAGGSPASQAPLTGAGQDVDVEMKQLRELLRAGHLPTELAEKAEIQLERINLALRHGGNINQLDSLTKYITWITSLPWTTSSQDVLDINQAKVVMDKNHFGLEKIKKRVLEYLSILILQKKQVAGATDPGGAQFHAPILFFVGLAGTGKTTFAKSIAESLGRKFIRIPFGGLSSALDLRGLSKVQHEAEPGQIMKSLRRCGTKNPVILLDELDRISKEAYGEIMGVLIELLDPEQNNHFIDHYIDFPFDLSQVIFVATANNTQSISTAVMDRLEIIQMPSYTDDEKIHIAQQFILPRLMRESGLSEGAISVADEVWKFIARQSGYDPGIRSVERKVESLVRMAAFKIVSAQGTQFTITMENLKEFLE